MPQRSAFRSLPAVGLVIAASTLALNPVRAEDRHRRDPPTPVTQRSLRELAQPIGLRVGTAVDMNALANDQTYRDTIAREFSSVTAENVMKWDTLEPQQGVFNYGPADQLIAFAAEHRIAVRGHVLVWHNQNPSWVNEQAFTPDQLRDILREHVLETARHFKGKLYQWDVVNEALNDDGTLRDTIWLRNLGEGYIADVFRWAHSVDRNVKLFYNDFNLEFFGPKSDAAYALVKHLLAQGVPIDGIGFQGHLGAQFGFDTRVQENMQRFADLASRSP
jgi:endo-1,4-beta-xylanase